jgi:hypothetical protein
MVTCRSVLFVVALCVVLSGCSNLEGERHPEDAGTSHAESVEADGEEGEAGLRRRHAAEFFVGNAQEGSEGGAIATRAPETGNAFAAQDVPEISPVKARDRDFYAPHTEDLGPDEMRIVACGTDIPVPG